MIRRPAHKHGFTLIEVLVVVSVIALLISILLPSLNKARGQARSAVCLANLHRLGHAVVFYTDTYKVHPPFRLEKVLRPSTGLIEENYVNRYGRMGPRWQWFFDYGVGRVIDAKGVAANSDEMTNDLFLCPELKGTHERNERNGAYGYNYQYLANTRVSSDKKRYAHWPVGAGMIKAPGRTVLVADSRGDDLPHGLHSYSLDPPRLAVEHMPPGTAKFGPSTGRQHSPVEMRHGDRGNVAFTDGHAERMMLRQLGYSLDSDGIAVGDGPGASNHLWTGKGMDPAPKP